MLVDLYLWFLDFYLATGYVNKNVSVFILNKLMKSSNNIYEILITE